MVEHLLAKEKVASSNLVFRSNVHRPTETLVIQSPGFFYVRLQARILHHHANATGPALAMRDYAPF